MAAIPLGACIIILRISLDNWIGIEVIILSLKRTPRKIWDVLCGKLNIDYGKIYCQVSHFFDFSSKSIIPCRLSWISSILSPR
jgi:hypothetical protein